MSVKWLKQFLGGGFKVTDTEGGRWIVSLIYPSGALSLIDGLKRTPHVQAMEAGASRSQSVASMAGDHVNRNRAHFIQCCRTRACFAAWRHECRVLKSFDPSHLA